MVPFMTMSDADIMALALEQAEAAAARGEVPIGAVVIERDAQTVVAATGNRTIELNDPTAHAEILALREAGAKLGNYRLLGCELFVTLEPCAMCAGAVSLARVDRLVYGAPDPKGGGVVHGGRFFEQPTCHHRPIVDGGVLADNSAQLLRDFFAARR